MTEHWRTCEVCTANEAMVWCHSHGKYICEFCLPAHAEGGLCSFISMAVARQLSEQARAEV